MAIGIALGPLGCCDGYKGKLRTIKICGKKGNLKTQIVL